MLYVIIQYINDEKSENSGGSSLVFSSFVPIFSL